MDQDIVRPMVSVVMPVYNAGSFLREAIDSVLAQTFADFEFVIVNDASKDDSLSVMRMYNDPRIIIVDNSENLGISDSLNKAINLASGEFIARMDADDIMLPQRLEMQVRRMKEDAAIAVLATLVEFVNTDGEVTGTWSTDQKTLSCESIRQTMAKTNCIAHPSVMMRKDVVEKFPYRRNYHGAEDWDLWLRLLYANHRIEKIPQILLQYRMHPASITSLQKAEHTLENRLLRIRRNAMQWSFNGFALLVLNAQLRTFARHILSNVLPNFARSVKRIFTYSPFALIQELNALKRTLENWDSRHLFVFPYVHPGGAEQVHADILTAAAVGKPLVLITNFSDNSLFLERFQQSATVLEIPRIANHPFTKSSALRKIAAAVHRKDDAVVFGSNSEWFFDLVPQVPASATLIYLIHAFRYQPSGNLLHKKWLRFFSLMSNYVFVSKASMEEFDRFCFYNNIPSAERNKLIFISNAVTNFSMPVDHPVLNVLFVGRSSEEKRLSVFLRIAQSVSAKFPDVSFTVVGSPMIAGHPNVPFIDMISDRDILNDVYKAHDLLLVTSSREGFPMVIMEAMAHGLVIASTPVGDVLNRLSSDYSFVSTSIDEEIVVTEFGDFIDSLIADRELLERMKQRAYEHAAAEFGWEHFRSAYEALLKIS